MRVDEEPATAGVHKSSRLRSGLRCAAALAGVWVVSFGSYPLHLTALAAGLWVVATLLLVPIGATLVDRVVGLVLLAAAPAVLVAWISPLAPWLVSPPVLTGLLGTAAACTWAIGKSRMPQVGPGDVVAVVLGMLTTGFFWIPFAGGGVARAIGVLSSHIDQGALYFMWVRVWANHGYPVVNTLADPDYWNWRAYPQGSQAVLADAASVLTSSAVPVEPAGQSVIVYSMLVTLLAGLFALVVAWSVERLARDGAPRSWLRVALWQAVAVLLVVIGPGSAVPAQSMSFTMGVTVTIPALVLAVTSARSPRRDGLLVAASLVASAAIYPICALTAVAVWPLYMWTSRRYWLASTRRRWGAVVFSALAALACAPTFVLLLLRHVDHNWDTGGYFQALNGVAYCVVALALALLLLVPGRLARPVRYALWVAAAVLVALALEAIVQWITAVQPTYYTIKMTYLGWALAVVAVASACASLSAGPRAHQGPTVRRSLLRSAQVAGVSVLVLCSLVMGMLLTGLDLVDTSSNWLQVLSKQAWISVHADSLERRYGVLALQVSEFVGRADGVTIVVPCAANLGQSVTRWAMYLTGSLNEVEWDALYATCSMKTDAVLGDLPTYLRANPGTKVNVVAMTEDAYAQALAVQNELGLPNLVVVSPTALPVGLVALD